VQHPQHQPTKKKKKRKTKGKKKKKNHPKKKKKKKKKTNRKNHTSYKWTPYHLRREKRGNPNLEGGGNGEKHDVSVVGVQGWLKRYKQGKQRTIDDGQKKG